MTDLKPERRSALRRKLRHRSGPSVLIHWGDLRALLDTIDERDRLAEVESRLSVLLWRLTNGRLSKTDYPVEFMEQAIEENLTAYHESDLRDERDRLAAAEERVRALHRAVGIYDECDCPDDAKAEGHLDIYEVGLTCNKLYDICAECCRDGGYQTEDCASYHEHQLGETHHCLTTHALDEADEKGSNHE